MLLFILKGYTSNTYERTKNLNVIPKVFLVFSLITKVTNFVEKNASCVKLSIV